MQLQVERIRLRLHESRVRRGLASEMRARLRRLGDEMAAEVASNIAVPSPPPSLPGGFPHKDTGELQRKVYAAAEPDGLGVRVGSRAPHAAAVEATRPFLWRTLLTARHRIEAILGRGFRSARLRLRKQ